MAYCHVNDAFNADHLNNDLDVMARKVNDNKRLKNNDIYKSFRKNNAYLNSNGCDTLVDSPDDPSDGLNGMNGSVGSVGRCVDGFYTRQGEYMNNNPLIMADKESRIKELKMEKNIKGIHDNTYRGVDHSEAISLDTPSDVDSDSFSSDEKNTISTDEIKNEVIAKSKYTKNYCGKNQMNVHLEKRHIGKRDKCYDFDLISVDSLESLESGESLLEHAHKCYDCKKKLMDLIKKNHKKEKKEKNKHYREPNINLTKPPVHLNNRSVDMDVKPRRQKNMEVVYDYMELKNILIVCMIGFMIIVLMDIIIRT